MLFSAVSLIFNQVARGMITIICQCGGGPGVFGCKVNSAQPIRISVAFLSLLHIGRGIDFTSLASICSQRQSLMLLALQAKPTLLDSAADAPT